MAFGQFMDGGEYTDDHLIGKAMEALRMTFGNRLPESFYGDNWERARLILRVEGRASEVVFRSLLPFAEARASDMAQRKRRLAKAVEILREDFPHMARMIERGDL